jgi:tRNA threonylcarbamoyladenosine biosynthesis protein TsaB
VKKINTVLAIDTATDYLGVAIWNVKTDEKHVFSKNLTRKQSGMLHPVIQDILVQNRVNPSDIDLVVCTKGPGSFTGVRIGLAAAQGIASGVNASLVGVSTLEAMAKQGEPSTVWIGAIRGEVYTQQFDKNSKPVNDAEVLPVEKAAEQLKNGQLLCVHGDISLPDNMPDVVTHNAVIDPMLLAKIGLNDYEKNGETTFTPIYLSKLKYRKKNEV